MNASKQYAVEQGWASRISFKKTPKLTVKLISDEKKTINDGTKDIDGILIKVELNGEEKEIFTSSQSLIQQIGDYNEGDVVTIEMKSFKTDKGYRSTFDVKAGKGQESSDEEINAEDIPF